MATNKNALIRYQTLDRCFRNPGRRYFWKDLLDACNDALLKQDPSSNGIQRRQLLEDIKFMESESGWSVPLERIKEGREVYYRYEDLSFSINNQPLNTAEAEQIRSALQIISRFSGTPNFKWVDEMIPFFKEKFELDQSDGHVISFESNIDAKGTNYIQPLFEAITNQVVLQVQYKDFRSEESYEIIFHPYHLKQYNNRWFVFGLNEATEMPTWNLALDRIEHVEQTRRDYRTCEINWEEDYFFDIVGVTRPVDGEVEEVKLKFNSETAPYVNTKPIHPSQKSKALEDGLEVRIEVIPNFELEKLILSFGEAVEVIAPVGLREKISSRIKRASCFYV